MKKNINITPANDTPANDTPANVPNIKDAAKVTARKSRRVASPLDKASSALAKWGIDLDTSDRALSVARTMLTNGGADFVPTNPESDMLVRLAGNAYEHINAAQEGARKASIILALIDETEEYKNAINRQGKPYTSTLALARDLFPSLEKSTIANYITGGRKIYLPALRGTYGSFGKNVLANVSMTNASVLAGTIGNPEQSEKAISALKESMGKNTTLSTAKARKFVKDFKKSDQSDLTRNKKMESDVNMKAAAADVKEQSDKDMAKRILVRILEYVPKQGRSYENGELSLLVTESGCPKLKELLQTAIKSNETVLKTAVLDGLYQAIFQGINLENNK